MAETKQKKTAQEDLPETRTASKEEYDPWKDMVEITLPRHPKNEQNFQFVAVNDRRYQVPRTGKPVPVPRPVYEVLTNSAAAKDFAADRKEALEEESN